MRLFLYLLFGSTIILSSCNNTVELKSCEQQLFQAKNSLTPIKESLACLDTASIEDGYQIQRRLVQLHLKASDIQGFKAATTSKGSQNLLGIKELTSGVLFLNGVKASGDTVSLSKMVNPKIETEIGYRFKRRIEKEISLEDLKKQLAVVMPVLEVPDLTFADLKMVKGPQFVAANAFASNIVVGMARKLGSLNLDSVSVSLLENDKEINKGVGADVLEGQWETLYLLVNQIVKEGYAIEPHHILITGSMGKLLPLNEGVYQAKYSDFSEVSLVVVP